MPIAYLLDCLHAIWVFKRAVSDCCRCSSIIDTSCARSVCVDVQICLKVLNSGTDFWDTVLDVLVCDYSPVLAAFLNRLWEYSREGGSGSM